MARPFWFPLAIALAMPPAPALAMGAAVGKGGEQVGLLAARLAVATTAGRTTRWAQVTVAGASGGFAWLIPVRPGARLDLSSDAWLDALETASTPVVLPPSSPSCAGAVLDAERLAPATSPASTRPSRVAILFDEPSVEAFVADAGYAVPVSLDAPLATVFAEGNAVAALVYDTSALPVRTLRIVDDGAAQLPLALSGSIFGDVAVTAFVVGAWAEDIGDSPLRIDPSALLWGLDGRSNYLSLRASLLAMWQGTRWLTESATAGLLFDGVHSDATTSSPAVLDQYFALAASYGDATGDPSACAAAARATQGDSTSYVTLCPAGALGVVPGGLPCAASGDDGIPVDALLCGGTADDAALAVAGLSPGGIWVTRADGIVTAESARDVNVAGSSGAGAAGCTLRAAGYASTCTPQPPSGSAPPPQVPAASSSGDPSSGTSDAAAAAADGCAVLGSACSGDSSSSSGDGSSGCSGDSGGSGDSSGGCSSGGDSGGDGGSGGCSGSSGSSSNDCALARRSRPRLRSPVSRIVLIAAAVAFVVRRRGRRPGRTDA